MSSCKFEDIAIVSKDKKKPTEEDKHCYVGLEHLSADTFEVLEYGSEVAPKGEKLIMRKGDVLFGKRRAYQKKVGIAPCDGIFSAHGMVLRPNTKVVDPNFFPFFIKSDCFLDEAIRVSVGSLSPTVNWKDLKNLEFDLPSLEKQEELAELLWAGEKTKRLYQKLLKASDDIAKSRFVEMFGRLEKNPYKWPVAKFEEFATIDTHMTNDFERYANMPHIGIDSIESATGKLSGYRTVAEDGVKSGKYPFDERHVIYSKIRPALNKVALPDFEGVCSADAYPILPNEVNCNRVFLAYAMRSRFFLDYVLPLSTRAQMPKVNKDALKGFAMPLPPLGLQQDFADFVAQVDKSRFTLQQALDDLNATMKAILDEELGLGNV